MERKKGAAVLKSLFALVGLGLAGCNAGSIASTDLPPEIVTRPLIDGDRDGKSAPPGVRGNRAQQPLGDKSTRGLDSRGEHKSRSDRPAYDLAKDFSAEENPHGQWSFGTFNHIYTGTPNELRDLRTYGELKFTIAERKCGGSGLKGWGDFSWGFLGLGATATGIMKNTGRPPVIRFQAARSQYFPSMARSWRNGLLPKVELFQSKRPLRTLRKTPAGRSYGS